MTVPSMGSVTTAPEKPRGARHGGEGETRRGGLCDGAQDARGSRAAVTRSAGPEDGVAGRRAVESAPQWRGTSGRVRESSPDLRGNRHTDRTVLSGSARTPPRRVAARARGHGGMDPDLAPFAVAAEPDLRTVDALIEEAHDQARHARARPPHPRETCTGGWLRSACMRTEKSRVAGPHCCGPAPSEPCWRVVPAHGSSKP
jgi:hypothetical protein